jgi:hypothetical protein
MEDINAKMGKRGDTSFRPRQRKVFMGISEPEKRQITKKWRKLHKGKFRISLSTVRAVEIWRLRKARHSIFGKLGMYSKYGNFGDLALIGK